jgi:hypothetical protein
MGMNFKFSGVSVLQEPLVMQIKGPYLLGVSSAQRTQLLTTLQGRARKRYRQLQSQRGEIRYMSGALIMVL